MNECKPTEASMLPTLRALIEAYMAMTEVAFRHMKSLGLTPDQFDILATLGDTAGMSCKDLGQDTLITKGTLTGVLDRLENKGLLARSRSESDSRSFIIALTPEGQALYEETFMRHVHFMRTYFDRMPEDHQVELQKLLRELKSHFRS